MITIILLLILTGVGVAMLTGGNGILNKAVTAKNRTLEAEQEERDRLADIESELSKYDNVTSRTDSQQTVQNTMSETEHFIGEYYLDNKPIYAKTVYVESLPNKESKVYNHNIDNVDNIWFDTSKCYVIWKNGTIGPLPYAHSSSIENTIEINITNKTTFTIVVGIDRRTLKAYITFNYTKTNE